MSSMSLAELKYYRNPSFAFVREIETVDYIKLRTAYWPSFRGEETPGTVCILQGRAECIEKYYETVGELLQRGLGVLAFDWRGQGGSERLLDDSARGHVEDFIEYQYDLLAVVRKLLPLTPPPYFCLASGMGGLVALEAMLRGVSPFERQVLVSPTFEFSNRMIPKLGGAATWVGKTLGYGEEYFTGNEEYFVWSSVFDDNPFTTDEERYKRMRLVNRAFEKSFSPLKPVMMPTFSWMQAAYRQMTRLQTSDFKVKLTIPTVAVAGSADRISSAEITEKLLKPSKIARFLPVHGARHDLLQERNVYRKELWAAFDVFVPGEVTELPRRVA